MMKQIAKVIGALATVSLAAGCATTNTTSFAPPRVNVAAAVTADGKCPPKAVEGATRVTPTVVGARILISNFAESYYCAMTELADGRQSFQVPAALLLAGGAAAAAFGASPDVAIATGSGSALFQAGNRYYAPQEKARIVSAAHNAVVCIQQEASGIRAMQISNPIVTQQIRSLGGGASIAFDPEVQYFDMVQASLRNISSILAGRLSTIGSYAPDAIATEIANLAKKRDDADNKPPPPKVLVAFTGATGDDPIVVAEQALEKLQPRLELCVIRAKPG